MSILLNKTPEYNRELRKWPVPKEAHKVKVEYGDKKYDFTINPNTLDVYLGDFDFGEGEEYVEVMGPMLQMPRQRYLCLQPTLACNQACVYCFAQYYKDTGVKVMSFAEGKRAIDMFLPPSPKENDYFHIGFFGGEPLCAFPIIRKLVYYTAGKLSNQKRIQFHMTTNATLVTDEWIELFKEFKWTFIVSMDGPRELHNETRKMHDGGPTYDKVVEGLKKLAEVSSNITLRGTYVPKDNMHVLDRVRHLNQFVKDGYANHVSVEPVQMSEQQCLQTKDMPMPFNEEDTMKLQEEIYECAEWYVQEVLAGNKPVFHNFSKTLERFVWKSPAWTECGAGRGYFTCASDGNVYACHRLNATKIGTLKYGINEMERAKWLENRIYEREDCMSCPWRYFCGGGCRQNSTFNMGNIHKPNPTECRLKGTFFRGCLYIMARLNEEGAYTRLYKIIMDPLRNSRVIKEKKSTCACNIQKK